MLNKKHKKGKATKQQQQQQSPKLIREQTNKKFRINGQFNKGINEYYL